MVDILWNMSFWQLCFHISHWKQNKTLMGMHHNVHRNLWSWDWSQLMVGEEWPMWMIEWIEKAGLWWDHACNVEKKTGGAKNNDNIMKTNTHDKVYSVHWWMSFTVVHTTTWTIRQAIREGGGRAKAVIGGWGCGGQVGLWSLWAVYLIYAETDAETVWTPRVTDPDVTAPASTHAQAPWQ